MIRYIKSKVGLEDIGFSCGACGWPFDTDDGDRSHDSQVANKIYLTENGELFCSLACVHEAHVDEEIREVQHTGLFPSWRWLETA